MDAGCGDGRISKHVLALLFDEIDMFDNASEGVKECQKLAAVNSMFKRVEVKSFKTWEWKDSYDAIVMTWSSGYLKDTDLVKWLKRSKRHLNAPEE